MSELIIYSKPNCPQCNMVKYVLKSENIEYKEKDITKDESSYNYIKEKGFMSVPILFAEGIERIVGFQPEKIKALKQI